MRLNSHTVFIMLLLLCVFNCFKLSSTFCFYDTQIIIPCNDIVFRKIIPYNISQCVIMILMLFVFFFHSIHLPVLYNLFLFILFFCCGTKSACSSFRCMVTIYHIISLNNTLGICSTFLN